MNLRQAAQQALEALETNNKAWKHLADSGDAGFWEAEEQPFYEISVKAITALRAALAEPEQEPVRLQCTTCGTVYADGVPPQVPEQEPQTTHWEGCEAVHAECKERVMDRELLIRLARDAAFHTPVMEGELMRFAALVAAHERNKIAAWIIDRGYATGHGDTTEDLLKELEWQIKEREREACAQIAEEWLGPTKDRELHIATAIRSRK